MDHTVTGDNVLWKSDGTSSGTVIVGGSGSDFKTQIAATSSAVYYGRQGELYKSTGSLSVKLEDVCNPSAYGLPDYFFWGVGDRSLR